MIYCQTSSIQKVLKSYKTIEEHSERVLSFQGSLDCCGKSRFDVAHEWTDDFDQILVEDLAKIGRRSVNEGNQNKY